VKSGLYHLVLVQGLVHVVMALLSGVVDEVCAKILQKKQDISALSDSKQTISYSALLLLLRTAALKDVANPLVVVSLVGGGHLRHSVDDIVAGLIVAHIHSQAEQMLEVLVHRCILSAEDDVSFLWPAMTI